MAPCAWQRKNRYIFFFTTTWILRIFFPSLGQWNFHKNNLFLSAEETIHYNAQSFDKFHSISWKIYKRPSSVSCILISTTCTKTYETQMFNLPALRLFIFLNNTKSVWKINFSKNTSIKKRSENNTDFLCRCYSYLAVCCCWQVFCRPPAILNDQLHSITYRTLNAVFQTSLQPKINGVKFFVLLKLIYIIQHG